jgi:long-chain acyl-CoA synthetase
MSQLPSPVEMLFERASKTPNEPYLHQPVSGNWTTWTWAQVADQARRMATALQALGLPRGSRIALTGMNTAHWFMADFACGIAGYVGVGLYPKQSQDAVRYILEHSEARAMFVGPMPDAEQFLAAVPEHLIRISLPYPGVANAEHQWNELVNHHEPIAQAVSRADDELWSLIYTSGTTGNPKGVIITKRNLTFTADGLLRMMPPVFGGEVFLSYLPLAHAFERGAVELGSLYLGAQVYFLEELEKLPATLAFVRPTRFYGVPLVWTRIQAGILKQVPQEKLDKLLGIPIVSALVKRKIKKGLGLDRAWLRVSGAAPLPLPVLEWFSKLGLDIYQGYGMTENSIYVSVNMPNGNRNGSVGKPYEDSLIRIADDGEIQNKHDGISPGYYKDEAKTAELFTADGWLHTGDVGRLDEEGYLYITGRVKEIFKTLKGKYVTPAPIEGRFATNTDIEQLCLVGSGLFQPMLVVSLNADAQKKPREQIERELVATMGTVNKTLEDHESICKIVISRDTWSIDNGMMTPTMKVRRNEVEKRYSALLAECEKQREVKVVWES